MVWGYSERWYLSANLNAKEKLNQLPTNKKKVLCTCRDCTRANRFFFSFSSKDRAIVARNWRWRWLLGKVGKKKMQNFWRALFQEGSVSSPPLRFEVSERSGHFYEGWIVTLHNSQSAKEETHHSSAGEARGGNLTIMLQNSNSSLRF